MEELEKVYRLTRGTDPEPMTHMAALLADADQVTHSGNGL